MGEARRRKLALEVPTSLIRCHYCGDVVDTSEPHFRYYGEKPYYWHAAPRQCMGKDMVRTVLCIERRVM